MGHAIVRRTITAALGTSVVLALAAPAQAQAFNWHRADCVSFAACDAAGLGNAGYSSEYRTSHWGMYGGHNCTNYAAYRVMAAGVDASYLRGQGNAYQWGTVAAAHGVAVDHNPQVGDTAWFTASPTMGSSGHVAHVEAVDLAGGRVRVSEDNWGGDFDWRWYDIADVTGFIHFGGKPGGSVVVPAGTPGDVVTAGTRPAAGLTARISVPSTSTTTTATASLTWSGADRYTVEYRIVTANDAGVRHYSAPSAWRSATTDTAGDFTGTPGGVYQFRVRAVDTAGGAGAWSGWGTVAMPVDDATLTSTGPWTTGTSPTRYNATYRYTTAPGADVSTTAWTDRVVVLGSRSFGTGQASLWVDGVNRTTFDTVRPTSAHRQVLASLTLPYGRHTVKVVNLATPGRPYLYLDGVALRR